jgi:hypothetical protein
MNIFGSIFITFESNIIFEGSWGSIENWLKPKTEPLSESLARKILETLCFATCGEWVGQSHPSFSKKCFHQVAISKRATVIVVELFIRFAAPEKKM